jgi:hypothetical protein
MVAPKSTQSKSRIKPKPKSEGLDLDPDAWPKFEALVKSAVKMGHKPHSGEPKSKPEKQTGR